jgi:hypothetical protein
MCCNIAKSTMELENENISNHRSVLQYLKLVISTTKFTYHNMEKKLKLISCNIRGKDGPNIKTHSLQRINHLLQHSKIISCNIPKIPWEKQ